MPPPPKKKGESKKKTFLKEKTWRSEFLGFIFLVLLVRICH
jgi:hypothetical protein